MTKTIDIATKIIKRNEGLRLEVYTCPAGFKTFGFGTNLEVVNLAVLKEVARLYGEATGDVDFGFRYKQIGVELAMDYIDISQKKKLASLFLKQELLNCAKALIKHAWFTDDLSDFQQAIILDLAYNIGVSGVLKFKKMIKAIKERNYGLAFTEMLDSKYHYQMICYGYKEELSDAGIDINNEREVIFWHNNLDEDYKKLRSASNALSLQFDKPLGKYKELF